MPGTQPARGMRDFLPEDVRRREHVIDVISRVYERSGFEPLETPAVENLDTLMGKYGEEGDRLIFKILKRGDEGRGGEVDLALRYDLTVPLARVVAEYRGRLPRFFKRYQIQPVWRADRPQRGRFREFYQCDVDAIGSRSPLVEAELCAAASEALTGLGFKDFLIRLNHRGVLAGILDAAGVPAEQHAEALVTLDKLEKIGAEGAARELAERGVSAAVRERLLTFFCGRPSSADIDENTATVQEIRRFIEGRGAPETSSSLSNLEEIVALCDATPAAGRVRIDPSLARGLSYYTGAIMEIAVPDLAGSLGGGGRYDNLIGMFLGEEVPACGLSLGLERIIVVMTERGMFPAEVGTAPADVMVTIWDEEARGEALRLAQQLRDQKLRVDVYPDADRLGKQFKYAASRGVPFVAVLGDEERQQGTVAVKDMRSGEQQAVSRAELAGYLRSRLWADAST